MNELQGKVIEVRRSLDGEATKKIGESLKEMRKLSGLTQAELARRLKVGQATVSRVEAGRGNMKISAVQKFVEAFGGTLRVVATFPADAPLSLHIRDAFEGGLYHEDQLVLPMFDDDAFRPHRDVVLSIRPKFAGRIMAGEKTVELRRRFPVSAPKGTIAYIYSTSPERAMVGHAEISGVHKLDMQEIWRRYADAACIERAEFESYFEGLEHGFALEFANVRPFATPLSLRDLREQFGFEPPQSFLYAKMDLRRALNGDHSTVSH